MPRQPDGSSSDGLANGGASIHNDLFALGDEFGLDERLVHRRYLERFPAGCSSHWQTRICTCVNLNSGYEVMKPGQLLKLLKPVYGRPDAPRGWYNELARILEEEMGFNKCKTDPAMFALRDERGTSRASWLFMSMM